MDMEHEKNQKRNTGVGHDMEMDTDKSMQHEHGYRHKYAYELWTRVSDMIQTRTRDMDVGHDMDTGYGTCHKL